MTSQSDRRHRDPVRPAHGVHGRSRRGQSRTPATPSSTRFTLPDGSSESITLTATTSTSPGPNQFTIGATSDLTAANLQTALTASVGKLAATSLSAASAVAASNDFFNIDARIRRSASPVRRSMTATALVAGTAANTVIWYTGEARHRSGARDRDRAGRSIDHRLLRDARQRGGHPLDRAERRRARRDDVFAERSQCAARSAALNQRVGAALDVPPGTQKVEDIEAELAGAQMTLAAATDRHQQTKSTLADMLQEIEGVSNEEVAAKILALQTRLQASLQTTSLLYQTSLVNYI